MMCILFFENFVYAIQCLKQLKNNNKNNKRVGSFSPQISSEGDNVYVVWFDFTAGNGPDIFFAASNDNGQTFDTPAENISNNTGFSLAPQISSEGNNVYIVWRDIIGVNNEILFAVSPDNGHTFSTPADNLSNNTAGSFFPQISSSTS